MVDQIRSDYRGHRNDDLQAVLVEVLVDEYPSSTQLARLRHEHAIEKELGIAGVLAPIGLEELGHGQRRACRRAERRRRSLSRKGTGLGLSTVLGIVEQSGRRFGSRSRSPTWRPSYTSGYTDDAIMRHGVLDGTKRFLHKPFSGEEIAREVRALLDKRAKRA